MLPLHRNTPHKEFMRLMQAFGRTKEEHQKLVMPAITVFMRRRRPEKDNALALHELNFPFTCCIRTSQLSNESFLVQRGTPR
ncbi:unnamed protein product [Brassica rapa subsp. trilocularis]